MATKLTKEEKKALKEQKKLERAEKIEAAKEKAAETWENIKTPVLIGLGALGGAGLTAGGFAIGKAIKDSKAKKAEEEEHARITAITPPECLQTPNWEYTADEQARLDACAPLDFPNTESTDTPSTEV